MLADTSRVAKSLREDTFAGTVARLRDHILQQLRETGAYTIREGNREFKITIQRPADR
jgi:hypothetical protein